MHRCLALLLLFAACAAGACKPEVAQGKADGAAVFNEVCARCHGLEGTPPPQMARALGVRDLGDAAFQDSIDDATLRKRIAEGTDNRRMPAFAGALTPAQIDAVVAHLRTLARTAE
ncbi:c-type cytochrome [Haliangium ochraceum]|uniref:Cytochrome c class I n=1 Tax=Haliangium ochraceum (strain DSM 14365 / JCM 11303 / SMP-2) TaxID=502025 RepID=D0LTL5_HALO1|nr:cytochrome c [Haliangium ochraceum]ACY15709.1 cytochrome c class I [Haliangium ochraceum DSM 14365]